jgi:hypothetical protein
VRSAAAADRLRDAVATPYPVIDQPVLVAGIDPCHQHQRGRLFLATDTLVLLGRADLAAQGHSAADDSAPADPQAQYQVGRGNHIPTIMLVGLALVVFAFNLAAPISQMAATITRSTLGIAMASVLLSFLMMITRSKAVPQVVGFLAMENGLFFAATSATYGMPMVVELGIALDVLVGMFILGIFFFQIRTAFDSLDLKHMEKLKEE